MKKIELNKKTIIIALALIILLQSIVYFVVATNKSYIHIDEGYSYGLINYDKLDITNNEDFYNQWHDKEYYSDYLTISEEEKYDWSPVYEQQKNDVHPPFYYFLLRIANSFSIGKFTIWPGVILNIVLHIGITIFTYLIASKLFKNKAYGLAIALVGGLTVATLETILLTRMYALTALGILAITYLHIINLEKEKLDIKNLVAIGICAVLGSLTHYYYLVYLFVLYAIYVIIYITKKQYKNAINYTITMAIAAGISLAIFPYSFVHIFMGYRGQGMLSNLTNSKVAWEGIGTYSGLTIMNVFNGFLVVILIATIAILIYEFYKKKELTIRATNQYLGLVLFPTLVYFVIIAMGTPYKEIRYIMPIVPLLFIIGIYGFKIALEKVFTEKKANIIMIVSAVILLITPIIFNWNITYQYPEEVLGYFGSEFKELGLTKEQAHGLLTKYTNFELEQFRAMTDIEDLNKNLDEMFKSNPAQKQTVQSLLKEFLPKEDQEFLQTSAPNYTIEMFYKVAKGLVDKYGYKEGAGGQGGQNNFRMSQADKDREYERIVSKMEELTRRPHTSEEKEILQKELNALFRI